MLAQERGRERGEAPVLAAIVERIGRTADARTAARRLRRRPCVGAVRRDAHGEVEIEADAHAGGPGAPLGLGELPIGDPLQPHVKQRHAWRCPREDRRSPPAIGDRSSRASRASRAEASRDKLFRKRLEERE